jgi:tetratricopeptide (TPR) repeat protein
LAIDYTNLGEYALAKTYTEMGRAVHERLGNQSHVAFTLGQAGWIALKQRLYAEAYIYFEQAVSMYRQLGVQGAIANELIGLAEAAIGQGRYALAERHCRESLSIFIHMRRSFWIEPLLYLGYLTARSGNVSRGIGILSVTLASLDDLHIAGDLRDDFDYLHTLGEKHLAEVRAELAPEAFAAAQETAKSLEFESLANEILASSPLLPGSAGSEA